MLQSHRTGRFLGALNVLLSSLEQGLPADHATTLHFQPGGSVWAGGASGLVELLNPAGAAGPVQPELEWRYYNGDRWLPTDGMFSAVVAVAATAFPAGSSSNMQGDPHKGGRVVHVATAVGLAAIRVEATTLEKKMEHYETTISPRHDRYGWVASVPLGRPGDLASFVPTDGDNDGSSTGYYLAAQIYRHNITQDAAVKAGAWRHVAALEFLFNVTRPLNSGRRGFIARTAVKCGEPHQGPSGGICHVGGHGHCSKGICPGCSAPAGSCSGFACPGMRRWACMFCFIALPLWLCLETMRILIASVCVLLPGWANSTECYTGIDGDSQVDGESGCCWSFKSDTSTDETDGHFYALSLAYDELAYTEAEKVRLASLLCDATSYMVDNGMVYIDPLTGNR